jgi:signal transduction histidine kinase
MAGQIKVAARRMSRMISDLLELTRMSQGKEVPVEPFRRISGSCARACSTR